MASVFTRTLLCLQLKRHPYNYKRRKNSWFSFVSLDFVSPLVFIIENQTMHVTHYCGYVASIYCDFHHLTLQKLLLVELIFHFSKQISNFEMATARTIQIRNSIDFVYFLFQARTLAPVLAENNEIRFFVATQTLKPQNQIHLVELSENSSALKQRVGLRHTPM